MKLATLDIISRRYLLENGLPIHYYAEALFHGATCLRELSFDTLQIVNVMRTPVDSTGSFYTPDDFVDDIAVCMPSSQGLTALPKQEWINPIRLHDATTGQFATYNTEANTQAEFSYGFPYNGFTWFWNVNAFGEPTGRMFGSKGGTKSGYKFIRNERRIQMTEDFIGANVVLMYISDGQSVDNATQIEVQAFSCINSFIEWKRSPNKNNEYSPEGRLFSSQKRLLRARKDDLTLTDLRNILHNAYTGGIKN